MARNDQPSRSNGRAIKDAEGDYHQNQRAFADEVNRVHLQACGDRQIPSLYRIRQVRFAMLELLDDVRHTLLAHGLKPISPFSCRWVSANESERLYHVLYSLPNFYLVATQETQCTLVERAPSPYHQLHFEEDGLRIALGP